MTPKQARVSADADEIARKRQAAELLGERLRYYRKQRGLTKADVAAKLDCHWTTVNNIERGVSAMTMTVYRAIQYAQILGVGIDVLLKRIEV